MVTLWVRFPIVVWSASGGVGTLVRPLPVRRWQVAEVRLQGQAEAKGLVEALGENLEVACCCGDDKEALSWFPVDLEVPRPPSPLGSGWG